MRTKLWVENASLRAVIVTALVLLLPLAANGAENEENSDSWYGYSWGISVGTQIPSLLITGNMDSGYVKVYPKLGFRWEPIRQLAIDLSYTFNRQSGTSHSGIRNTRSETDGFGDQWGLALLYPAYIHSNGTVRLGVGGGWRKSDSESIERPSSGGWTKSGNEVNVVFLGPALELEMGWPGRPGVALVSSLALGWRRTTMNSRTTSQISPESGAPAVENKDNSDESDFGLIDLGTSIRFSF